MKKIIKNSMKYVSLTLIVIGSLLMVYALFDRHPLSLGQSFLFVGAVFLTGGILLLQLTRLEEKIAHQGVLQGAVKSEAKFGGKSDYSHSQEQRSIEQRTLQTSEHFNQNYSPEPIPAQQFEPRNRNDFEPAIAPRSPVQAEQVSINLPSMKAPMIQTATAAGATIVAAGAAITTKVLTQEQKPSVTSVVPPTPVAENNTSSFEVINRNSDKLSQIARDFPELDALLKKEQAEKEAVEAPQEPAPQVEVIENVAPAPSIIREGQISGINFRLFSDGSIEADFVNGRHRFNSIAEFKAYVEG